MASKFGVVKAKDRSEWLIRSPGARLDHWGPPVERAEYATLESARAQRAMERAERFADIVEIPADAKDLETYTVVDAHDPDYRYDQSWRPREKQHERTPHRQGQPATADHKPRKGREAARPQAEE